MAKSQNTKPEDQKPTEQQTSEVTKPEPTEAEKQAQQETAKQQQDQAKAQEAADSNAEQAIKPAVEGVEENPEVKARVRQTLAHAGDTPKPHMVNGRSVVGKVYDEQTEQWVDDPDEAAVVRPADIFDRIGEAFPHEAQRLVIEELARQLGLGEDTTDLPEDMPTLKSTASLRTDVSGHGRFTGGGPGVKPVAPGVDGKAQA